MATRRGQVSGLLAIVTAFVLGVVPACGDDGGGTAENASGGGGSGGSGGSGNTDGGGGAGTGGIIDTDASGQIVGVEPPTATITITSKTTPATQQFTAWAGSPSGTAPAQWSLDTYDYGGIDTTGSFTTQGLAAGKVVVTATLFGKQANADLNVEVSLLEEIDPNIDPANKTALQGPPSADPGASESPPNPSKFLYPYDKTVVPRGLMAPLIQLSAGSLPPEAAMVTLTGPGFTWKGLYQVQTPATPRFTVPQDIWNAALASAAGGTLKVEVVKAIAGAAYGPYAIDITVAKGSLKGAVYYQTYEQPNNGIWAARPGTTDPAKIVKPGCVVCHSVSANGKYLAAGAEVGQASPESGIYAIDTAGNATQITQAPSGLGGDSRGISFAAFTPDGKYVTRSQNDFWGGVNQMAWKIDATGQTLIPATVAGLGANVSAYLPTFSPDGKRYAFTNGQGETGPPGEPSRSISVMDVVVDENNGPGGTLTFSNRQVVLDNGASGKIAKYATFLPDSATLVLQESAVANSSYGYMLPTWDQNSTSGGSDGRLYSIDVVTKAHTELTKLNVGNVAADENRNYEPFALPVPAGGYYWVVFTSTREYGNVYQGSAIRKQLWVAAITPGAQPGSDPSHPPFFLPNQTETRNERGFWALEPCKVKGASCQTGDECCDGFCRPIDPTDPTSPKVCGEGEGCSQLSEKCTTDADCCASETGVKCLDGYCSPPTPE